jgi:hypothetical protein
MPKVCMAIVFWCVVAGYVSAEPNKTPDDKEQHAQPKEPTVVIENKINSDKADHKPQAQSQWWHAAIKRPEWWLFLAAMLTFAATAYGVVVSAKAAKASVDSLISGERAWVLVTIETAPQGLKVFEVIITNHGRTPARIVEAMGDLKEVDSPDESLPEKPSYLTNMLPAKKLVAPNENWIMRTIGVGIKNTEQIFYGYVAYRHIFDKPSDLHYTRFCYRLQSNGKWQVTGPPAYNDYT